MAVHLGFWTQSAGSFSQPRVSPLHPGTVAFLSSVSHSGCLPGSTLHATAPRPCPSHATGLTQAQLAGICPQLQGALCHSSGVRTGHREPPKPCLKLPRPREVPAQGHGAWLWTCVMSGLGRESQGPSWFPFED